MMQRGETTYEFTPKMKFQKEDSVEIETSGKRGYLDGLTGTIRATKISGTYTRSMGTPYLVHIPELDKEIWITSEFMERQGGEGMARLEKYRCERELRISRRNIGRKLLRLRDSLKKPKVSTKEAAEIEQLDLEMKELFGRIGKIKSRRNSILSSHKRELLAKIQHLSGELSDIDQILDALHRTE